MHGVERYRIIDGSPEIITGDPRPIDRYFSNPANKVLQVLGALSLSPLIVPAEMLRMLR